MDKLMTSKGIEVAWARNLTYLLGLWKEQLLPAGLLWFTVEGPGCRLLNGEGGSKTGGGEEVLRTFTSGLVPSPRATLPCLGRLGGGETPRRIAPWLRCVFRVGSAEMEPRT